MKFELRDYQAFAVESTIDYLMRGKKPVVVAPTRSGKSLMIAALIKDYLTRWPQAQVLMLAHRQELIEQNAHKVMHYVPEFAFGIYCAGLGLKQVRKITIATPGSVYKKIDLLGSRHLVIVDEAHMIPPEGEGMYQKIFTGLAKKIPHFNIVGFTATPYRMKGGLLYDGDMALFDSVSCDIPVSKLLKEGFIVPLVTKYKEDWQADLTGVNMRGGDYDQYEMSNRMISVTVKALQSMRELTKERKSVLIFASSVEHAKMIQHAIQGSEVVTEETPKLLRQSILRRFRNGEIRHLINRDVLTTGFDAPCCDAVVLLRATNSPGLYVQMASRGMTINPGKKDCLLLDYGRNLERFGPIDAVQVGTKTNSNKLKAFAPPFKICPECMTVVLPRVPKCPDCGYVYPASTNLTIMPSVLPPMSEPEIMDVKWVEYNWHEKKSGDAPPSMRVDYHCGPAGSIIVSEWVAVENPASKKMAAIWWRKKSELAIPRTTQDMIYGGIFSLPIPTKIKVRKDKKFWRVLDWIETKENTNVDPEIPF